MRRLDPGQFGPNTWLIDEMYRRYVEDPDSVSDAWQEFFEDFQPRGEDGRATSPGPPSHAAAPAPPAPPRPEFVRQAPPAIPVQPAPAGATPLSGIQATIARRMEESLGVPTATSVRAVPAKLLEVNRNIVNRHLARSGGGKLSFTHLIGWAVVRALASSPAMRSSYAVLDGKPHVVRHEHVNLGLAVDHTRADGSRVLLVPNVKGADTLGFGQFLLAYEEAIRKVDANALAPDDLLETTATITNPGTLGTVQSVPRLMAGQSVIVGIGAIDYPAEFQGADPHTLGEFGVGKILTLTSTYDHRVIQGAESGEFLGRVHRLLIGEEGFYDDVFREMKVPYVPVRWRRDVNPSPYDTLEAAEKQGRVMRLMNMYRVRGHLIADLDPLAAKPPQMHPELDPSSYGLTIWDLDRRFPTGGLAGNRTLSLGEILAILRDAYCRTSSIEYMHIQEPDQKYWIRERVEGVSAVLSLEDQRQILHKLVEAEALERFLHQKYVGHKRFSLEGAESMIPMLDAILDLAADGGMAEAVIGMAHRGRLNVLANVIGKSYGQIFREFESSIDPQSWQGSGDVKYHVGAAGKHTARSGRQLDVSVASNPSHLESVHPVIEGIVRAKQDILDRGIESPVLPLAIHGDAAFAGQGVAAETLALSQLSGYRTGGTIHIIVNNQLGFTTGSTYGRSSTYASDVAKMVQAPIFHVNGDDPEACVRVARLAFEFRQVFKKDVVIDMWCYRRWGHNEADEPAFTQPLMYERIEKRRSVRKLFTETLVNRGDLSVEEAEASLEEFRQMLQHAFDDTRDRRARPRHPIEWKRPAQIPMTAVPTGVERNTLEHILKAITTVPEGFTLHPKLARWLADRRSALDRDAIDWSLAEALAFGTLLIEGVTVRLTGQDTRRGTFSQRHSVLVDQRTAREYTPLTHVPDARAKFFVYDSLLSEFAAVGFEYGYSVGNPDSLVAWEAQFGDFVNGAQVILDQYLAAAEDKWGQTSRLVLLLPHGFEGQGPEHSSARLERFIELAAEHNQQIVVPSTPAQYFHALRRQTRRALRKPLVVMTPKSLLRLPDARSATAELTDGYFREVLPDPAGSADPLGARRVLLSQGKTFYDLLERRRSAGIDEAALVRIEQLYPFPEGMLRAELARHRDAEVWWVQEEPRNMGAWWYLEHTFRELLGVQLHGVTRDESASPATGSYTIHQIEQSALLDRAFEGLTGPGA
ncbi:MAG: multifunctional oxoglutarate decarboxylase/oxoglutarate dehydrogenase thiamine pyrophosphate-binding subunit/dihydrolipoyllysine-residue succinyltransferase subunit [Actinomycetota bacterium]